MGLAAPKHMGEGGLSFPTEIEHMASALQGGFFTTGPPGESLIYFLLLFFPHFTV